jgi:hypothetical protein
VHSITAARTNRTAFTIVVMTQTTVNFAALRWWTGFLLVEAGASNDLRCASELLHGTIVRLLARLTLLISANSRHLCCGPPAQFAGHHSSEV